MQGKLSNDVKSAIHDVGSGIALAITGIIISILFEKMRSCSRNIERKSLDAKALRAENKNSNILKNFAMSESLQKEIKNIVDFLKNPKDHKEDFCHSVLLYGPPGTGKTSTVESIIAAAGVTGYYNVSG